MDFVRRGSNPLGVASFFVPGSCSARVVPVTKIFFWNQQGKTEKQKDKRGQQESNQRPQDLQSHALPLSYDPETHVDFSALQFHQEQGAATRRLFLPGALAQSEECVLCKHEVRGSKPRCSTPILFLPRSLFRGTQKKFLVASCLLACNVKNQSVSQRCQNKKQGVWGN